MDEKNETPQESLERCVKRLGELLAPILNGPRRPEDTINGYGLIEACGHVYMPSSSPWLPPSELVDLMNMNVERIQRARAKSKDGRAGEIAPGCSICMVEKYEQKLGKLLHWRLN